ncbi:MAG: LuxR C-terminal-related transcriptional regulator [Oscillospiraceae bacterium]|jgi:LuxR family maltose regulon positive regulatory protein|nr:LuxR C-terminal-related transcriptional regulator [Oscillospiraceae bacterium]
MEHMFHQALGKRLLFVVAGAGYGKTTVTTAFLRSLPATTRVIWLNLKASDNDTDVFWNDFCNAMALVSEVSAKMIREVGFPQTHTQYRRYESAVEIRLFPTRHFVMVLDNFHIVTNPQITQFLSHSLQIEFASLLTVILSRTMPEIDVIPLEMDGKVQYTSEDDLRLRNDEIRAYITALGFAIPLHAWDDIFQMIDGWGMALGTFSMCLTNANGDVGTALHRTKSIINAMLEKDAFAHFSPKEQRFLVKLSLLPRFEREIVRHVFGVGTWDFENPVVPYIGYDKFNGSYKIQPQYLAFLRKKQTELTELEINIVHRDAGNWYEQNGEPLEAALFYEKCRDYLGLVRLLNGVPNSMSRQTAHFFLKLIERLCVLNPEPSDYFYALLLYTYRLTMLRVLDLRQDMLSATNAVIIKFERENVPYASILLYSAHNSLGFLKLRNCVYSKEYDFDRHFADARVNYAANPLVASGAVTIAHVPTYVNPIGLPAIVGEFDCFADAMTRSVPNISFTVQGMYAGYDLLARCEYQFTQGNWDEAKHFYQLALAEARAGDQLEIECRAYFLLFRIGLLKGDYDSCKQAQSGIQQSMDNKFYPHIKGICELYLAWIQVWLTLYFPQDQAYSFHDAQEIELLIECKKAFMHMEYAKIISLVHNYKLDRTRTPYFLAEIEVLCVQIVADFTMNNEKIALTKLFEAYQLASPHGIITPFLEQGKAMKSVISFALRTPGTDLPKDWLSDLHSAISQTTKQADNVRRAFLKTMGETENELLTIREIELLSNLAKGLTRAQAAEKQCVSLNTIKSTLQVVYQKLGASNKMEALRIAAQNGIQLLD